MRGRGFEFLLDYKKVRGLLFCDLWAFRGFATQKVLVGFAEAAVCSSVIFCLWLLVGVGSVQLVKFCSCFSVVSVLRTEAQKTKMAVMFNKVLGLLSKWCHTANDAAFILWRYDFRFAFLKQFHFIHFDSPNNNWLKNQTLTLNN